VQEQIAAVTKMDEDAVPLPPGWSQIVAGLRAVGWNGPDLDPLVLRQLVPAEHVWADRLRQAQAVPADQTIGFWANRWLAGKVDEAKQGGRVCSGLKPLRVALDHFTAFAGGKSDVASINADLWARWGLFVEAKIARRDEDPDEGWAAVYASAVYHHTRSFVRWLHSREVLPQKPRNFQDRRRLTRPASEIKTYTNEEVKTLLDAAKGHIPDDLDPVALRNLSPSAHVWGERLRHADAVPEDQTIGCWAARWLNGKTDEANKGVRAASGLRPLQAALRHFTTFAGEQTPAAAINADLWSRWDLHVGAQVALRDDDPRAGWAANYGTAVRGGKNQCMDRSPRAGPGCRRRP
jgi:hypothetical protein